MKKNNNNNKGFNNKQKPNMPPNSSGEKPGAPNMTWLYVILFGLFLAFAFMDFGSKVQEIDRKLIDPKTSEALIIRGWRHVPCFANLIDF